jgi:cytochrome c biogenesis protein CcdA/glutaredoxin
MDRRAGVVVVALCCFLLIGAAFGAGNAAATPSDDGIDSAPGPAFENGSVVADGTSVSIVTDRTDVANGTNGTKVTDGTAGTTATEGSNSSNGTVCVVLFYSPSCPHCANVEAYLADVREDHDVTVRKYRVAHHETLFRDYLDAYEVPSNAWGAVPTVFVGADYAVGDTPAIDLIESKLEAGHAVECPSEDAIGEGQAPTGSGPQSGDGATDSSDGGGLSQCGGEEDSSESDDGCEAGVDPGADVRTIAGITGLAAVDAVNPCAIAVLLVLLTTISVRAGREGESRKVLAAGVAFSLAIFLTYFAMGLLLIEGLRSIVAVTRGTIDGLYTIVGAAAIVLGLLNLKDWYAHGAGGFVLEVPFSWRPAMQKRVKRASTVTGAFVAGVVVSAFLLPCTSGPYFVAGGILADLPWSQSLPLLAVYNAVFVLPMIAITVFVAAGFLAIGTVVNWREENVERLHLVAGVVLLALGFGMIGGVF